MIPDSPLDALASEILSSGAMVAMVLDDLAYQGRRPRHPRDVRDDAFARIREALAVTAERYDDTDIEVAAELLWHALEDVAAAMDWAGGEEEAPPPSSRRGRRRPRGRRHVG